MVATSIRKSGIEKLREERELKIELDSGEASPAQLLAVELLAKALSGSGLQGKHLSSDVTYLVSSLRIQPHRLRLSSSHLSSSDF